MATNYKFFVPGIARTAGSHSSYQGRIVHARPETKMWMDKIGWYFLQKYGRPCLITGAVVLELMFTLSRPKGHYGTGRNAGKLKPSAPEHPTTQPDMDKMLRAVQDGLTHIAWQDDSQVVFAKIGKRYCETRENTYTIGVEIEIQEI